MTRPLTRTRQRLIDTDFRDTIVLLASHIPAGIVAIIANLNETTPILGIPIPLTSLVLTGITAGAYYSFQYLTHLGSQSNTAYKTITDTKKPRTHTAHTVTGFLLITPILVTPTLPSITVLTGIVILIGAAQLRTQTHVNKTSMELLGYHVFTVKTETETITVLHNNSELPNTATNDDDEPTLKLCELTPSLYITPDYNT